MITPDLNCDLGENESLETTAELMRWIDSSNIACGGHAGDHESMQRCINLALKHQVRIGAHPGLTEEGGRGTRIPSPSELLELLEDQVLPFQALVRSHGATLHHIKLHGILYHATDHDAELATNYLDWCAKHVPHAILYLRSGGRTAQLAEKRGMLFWNECFLDRAYESDGSLRSRHHLDAVLPNLNSLQRRLNLWTNQQVLEAHNGEFLPLACQTFCLHSDSPQAPEFAMFAKKFFTLDSSDSSHR
jgi:UPF0271 protein